MAAPQVPSYVTNVGVPASTDHVFSSNSVTRMSAGQTGSGMSRSSTVTVNVHWSKFPQSSVAVIVTVTGAASQVAAKYDPLAGSYASATSASQLSVALPAYSML